MNIDSINNGIVLDHIKAGKGMEIYKLLQLDTLNSSVALIKNVKSSKLGKKDIVKIDSLIDLNLDVLGFVDPDITVNVIKNGKLVDKKRVELPQRLVNVIKCKNPRCITTVEQEIEHVFVLKDKEMRTYRCLYCDTQGK